MMLTIKALFGVSFYVVWITKLILNEYLRDSVFKLILGLNMTSMKRKLYLI